MTTTTHDIPLPGCTPEPLMSYLKALGILRLLSEQKDPEARGWWQNDIFWLRSPKLFEDTTTKEGREAGYAAMVRFFLEEYKPTPIVAPWAGGSGFFSGDNTNAVNSLSSSDAARCASYATVIHQVRRMIEAEQITKKPKDEEKLRLIRRYRRELPDDVVVWMDAAMVLKQHGQGFAPLLGTGGNDGRLDFTQNFMQRIVALSLHKNGPASDESRMWLKNALFASQTKLNKASVGQFSPGRAGGPNATQGMEGDSIDNPWDFILMIEGSLLFAGAAVRRFGVVESTRAAFPFTVRAVAAGFDSAASKDEAESRGELWLPLWSRPTNKDELCHLFGEGRAEVSGRPARDAADFARAVAGLGVDRGVCSFSRMAFLKRSGKAFLSTALGRFDVRERAEADHLREIDTWLESFQRAAGDKNAPARFIAALRSIDSAIFDFCRYGGKPLFQRILVALGRAERELALTEGKVGNSKIKPKPLVGLSQDWIDAANDDSPEFGIALALSQLYDPAHKIGPLRANLESVDWNKRCRAWAEKDRAVVWNFADLAANLTNVLQRRMMDGQRFGCEHLPMASRFTVSLDSIAAFIESELDDQRIEDLIWGLMLIDSYRANHPRQSAIGASDIPLPRDYALLKLLFLPRPIVADRKGDRIIWRLAREGESGITIRPEPRILPLLRAGRVGEACRIATQRLRISGLQPMPGPLPTGVIRDADWTELFRDPSRAQRLAAALLIPIASEAVNQLVKLVCHDRSTVAEVIATISQKGEIQ